MPSTIEPRLAEEIPVTLERLIGMVGGVAKDTANVLEKVVDLKAEVVQHRGEINALKSATQQLESDMKGAEEARTLAAIAVKQADEARVAAAKAQVDNSTQRWTPAMRLYATLGAIAAMVTIWYYLTHPHG